MKIAQNSLFLILWRIHFFQEMIFFVSQDFLRQSNPNKSKSHLVFNGSIRHSSFAKFRTFIQKLTGKGKAPVTRLRLVLYARFPMLVSGVLKICLSIVVSEI